MNITNEIIDSINKIDQVTMEAEYNVICSLCNAYTKQAMIMEYCDDISVFQETSLFMEDGEEGNKKKQNIFKRLWDLIKKLVKKLIRMLNEKIDTARLKRLMKDPDNKNKTIKLTVSIANNCAFIESHLTYLKYWLEHDASMLTQIKRQGSDYDEKYINNNNSFDSLDGYVYTYDQLLDEISEFYALKNEAMKVIKEIDSTITRKYDVSEISYESSDTLKTMYSILSSVEKDISNTDQYIEDILRKMENASKKLSK